MPIKAVIWSGTLFGAWFFIDRNNLYFCKYEWVVRQACSCSASSASLRKLSVLRWMPT